MSETPPPATSFAPLRVRLAKRIWRGRARVRVTVDAWRSLRCDTCPLCGAPDASERFVVRYPKKELEVRHPDGTSEVQTQYATWSVDVCPECLERNGRVLVSPRVFLSGVAVAVAVFGAVMFVGLNAAEVWPWTLTLVVLAGVIGALKPLLLPLIPVPSTYLEVLGTSEDFITLEGPARFADAVSRPEMSDSVTHA